MSDDAPCSYCGLKRVTWREVTILIGAAAVVSALSIIALLVFQEALR